ncbi:MAG: sigma-70 family RNA polymerase sigma factor [Pseudomonadota bacterium]
MAHEDSTDNELVRAYQSGDALAFDVLVLRHQDRLYRLARVWLVDGSRAADATQEVFLRAFRGLPRFRFRAQPFTWLYRTQRLVCFEMNRQPRDEPLPENWATSTGVDDRRADAELALDEVRALVSTLPERQRDVVLLRIFEDCSVRETAELMGCREGTVKALLSKARHKLADQLAVEP